MKRLAGQFALYRCAWCRDLKRAGAFDATLIRSVCVRCAVDWLLLDREAGG